MATKESNLIAADECISDESSYYGSLPASPSFSPADYLVYHDRLPTVIANARSLASDQPLHNRFEGRPAEGKQLNESVSDFVARLSPSETYARSSSLTSNDDDDGHFWIWVANPHTDPSAHKLGDTGALVREGRQALMEFLEMKSDLGVELDRIGKSQNLQRQLAKPREEVVDKLKRLARQYHVKSGKWMIFCTAERVDKVWKRVCEGIVDGSLGSLAKVARRSWHTGHKDEKKRDEQVICIYTRDFEDEEDVKRVLLGLRDLGLVSRDDKKELWYKCDAWTHLEINSGNKYGIKASLYGSVSVLSEKKSK